MIPTTMLLDDISASTDKEKANLFNKYFHFVFTRSTYSLLSTDSLLISSSMLNDIGPHTGEVQGGALAPPFQINDIQLAHNKPLASNKAPTADML